MILIFKIPFSFVIILLFETFVEIMDQEEYIITFSEFHVLWIPAKKRSQVWESSCGCLCRINVKDTMYQ